MPEHVHEWTIGIMFVEGSENKPDPTALCEICDEILNPDEIEIRVNATERLSAEDAGRIKDMHYPVAYDDDELMFVLYDYIATLKGLPLHPHTRNASALEKG